MVGINVAQPRVLLTNDDGHEATGLTLLRDVLVQAGCDVMVAAPDTNHSARAHAVHTSVEPLRVVRRDSEGVPTLVCSGSPADCVRIGILGRLIPQPDVVISGINHGANAGEDIHYSGTVAAAAEAALLGLPAVAVSQHGDDIGIPFLSGNPVRFPHLDYVADVVRWVFDHGLPKGVLLNVNLPNDQAAEDATLCAVGRRDWARSEVSVEVASGNSYAADMWAAQPPAKLDEGSDFVSLLAGNATIAALSVAGGLHDVLDIHRSHLESIPVKLRSP